MAIQHTNNAAAVFGRFEPELDYQFLPGCRTCGSPHPLAMKPVPTNIEECPCCGSEAGQPGIVKTEYAVLRHTPAILFGRLCLWAGRKLGALYERL